MAKAPNKSERWTDTEDAVVDMFPIAEAAELLGRTFEGVRCRRSLKTLGPPHGNKKPKKRLRREFFATGQGAREEVVQPPPLPATCRYCPKKHYTQGLCKACYRWVQRVVESGVVSWELAERLWLAARRGGVWGRTWYCAISCWSLSSQAQHDVVRAGNLAREPPLASTSKRSCLS